MPKILVLELNLVALLRCNFTIKFRGAPPILNLNETERQNRERESWREQQEREGERMRMREREDERERVIVDNSSFQRNTKSDGFAKHEAV